jgi:hypothetical protein
MKRSTMFTKAKIAVLILVMLIVAVACSQQPPGAPLDPQTRFAEQPPSNTDDGIVGGNNNQRSVNESEIDQTTQTEDLVEAGERVILMDASLSLVVDDATAKVNEIRALAVEMGGWVVNSSTSISVSTAGTETVYGNITVRIPSDRLYEAMDRIKVGVGQILNENINGQDVTQDYIDTSSRLANLEASEQQLQTIMDSAVTVEDVLAVQEQLTQVRGEIEVARGRIQYYDEASAFSAVTVYLAPPNVPFTQNDSWNPLNTVQGAFNLLVRVLRGAVDLVIGFVIFVLPLLILFGVPARLLWKRFGHRLSSKPIPSSTPPSTQ